MHLQQADFRDLVAAMAAGERQALACLITRFGPGLRRYVAQALQNEADAEDLMQDVFLKAWSNAARYDPDKAAVSTWLYKIASNLCIDRNRRLKYRQFIGWDTLPEPEDESPSASDRMDGSRRLAEVRRAMQDLPDRQRQAILLRAGGELSISEISQVMGCSSGAVEQLLVRGRASLRARLQELE